MELATPLISSVKYLAIISFLFEGVQELVEGKWRREIASGFTFQQ
jgi:hypothetical protein